MAGAGQDDPADIREGALQGVDRPPGTEVVGAVDQQDRDLEGLAGAEQRVAREAAAVGVEGPAALGVGPEERGRLAAGLLQGPPAGSRPPRRSRKLRWKSGRQVASGSIPVPET